VVVLNAPLIPPLPFRSTDFGVRGLTAGLELRYSLGLLGT
jgi:hypothetical protein